MGSPDWHFVGLTNFQRIFEDPTFWQTVRNSFIFTFGSEAIRLVIGLPLAFALNRTFKGKRIVQGMILIPFVIPIALSSLAWKWMFDSLYSVINWMLMTLHIIDYPWQWLGEPGLAMWSVIILNVWRGFPFSAVILLAGLTAVPHGGHRGGQDRRGGAAAPLHLRGGAHRAADPVRRPALLGRVLVHRLLGGVAPDPGRALQHHPRVRHLCLQRRHQRRRHRPWAPPSRCSSSRCWP